jgi:hypothetical protein
MEARAMTKAQEKTICRLRTLVERELDARSEIKAWEVEDYATFVSVYVVTGMKNDEGTLAQVFARDRAHLFIGKRGGTTFPVWNGKARKQTVRAFHWYSILEAVVAQNL